MDSFTRAVLSWEDPNTHTSPGKIFHYKYNFSFVIPFGYDGCAVQHSLNFCI